MENATKALLIAAGVLIGIIILSMLLLGYNQISNYYQQQSDNLSLRQIVELNKKFTNYDGKTIRGNEMLSVINSVVDYNTWVTQNANEGYEEIQLNISFEMSKTDTRWTSFHIEESSSYEEWIQEKKNEKSGINLREGFVPATTLFLKRLSDNKICGSISIRHELNEFLLNFGGHIGYSVTPSERGKGYGKLQLKKAIEEAKKLNITSCLITADVENIASNKTILSQGGVLENTVIWKNDSLNRYWIKL